MHLQQFQYTTLTYYCSTRVYLKPGNDKWSPEESVVHSLRGPARTGCLTFQSLLVKLEVDSYQDRGTVRENVKCTR